MNDRSTSSSPAPMPARFDGMALRAGAAVCLVVAVPFSIAARWAADSRDDSGLALLLTLGALIGFVFGAGVAAWVQRLGLPLAHGIVTAISTYVGAQAVFILVRALRGDDIRWYAALFNLAPVLGTGLIGGYLGSAMRRRGIVPSTESRSRQPGDDA